MHKPLTAHDIFSICIITSVPRRRYGWVSTSEICARDIYALLRQQRNTSIRRWRYVLSLKSPISLDKIALVKNNNLESWFFVCVCVQDHFQQHWLAIMRAFGNDFLRNTILSHSLCQSISRLRSNPTLFNSIYKSLDSLKYLYEKISTI